MKIPDHLKKATALVTSRRFLVWLCGAGVAIGCGYSGLRLVSIYQSRPLYGDFDTDSRCMGGHEIFLRLEESGAFENCPGHRQMRHIGAVVRTPSSVTVTGLKTGKPFIRVDLVGNTHRITRLRDGAVHDLPQVNDPFRTWLPKLLPEH